MTQVIGFNRTQHLLGNINIQHTVTVQRTVLEGVPVILGLGQVLCRECAAVDDKQPAFNKIVQVGDQAAGFIATSTSSSSPAVVTSSAPK